MKLTKSIDKMMTRRVNTLKMILRPSNLPRLFVLLLILAALYYVYKTYLKEGMKGGSSDPYETTPDRFDQDVLSGSGKKLCLFYAGWCGHCHKILGQPGQDGPWTDAANSINTEGDIKMWKVNVGGDKSPEDATSAQEALGQKYKVQGYPTILVFENGQLLTEYEGPRTKEGFMKMLSS
jgi:thiol-disulfide isomerase/thioredoxin